MGRAEGSCIICPLWRLHHRNHAATFHHRISFLVSATSNQSEDIVEQSSAGTRNQHYGLKEVRILAYGRRQLQDHADQWLPREALGRE